MKSQTQYFFHVTSKDAASSSRRVALLGHQTLADLHELVYGPFVRSNDRNCSFLIESGRSKQNQSPATRLDALNLSVGQTFEYITDPDRRHEITVEGIDL